MERYKAIKETLVGVVEEQLGHLDCVDAKELGEVVDMIKDIEESMYYCSITEAMKESKEDKEIEEKIAMRMRDMDKDMGRMYYTERYQPRNRDGEYMPYRRDEDRSWDGRDERGRRIDPSEYREREMRDSREGKSPKTRKMYMESKELHKDKASKMQELEKYMKELAEDIMEMIEDASPEERQILEKKMSQLSSKLS